MANLEGVWTKLERARFHIKQLEGLIGAFHETNLHFMVREEDSEAGKWRLVYRGDPPEIPVDVPLTAGDAAHNLRSALDHFAFAVVPRGVVVEHRIQFPIWRGGSPPSEAQWRNAFMSTMQGVSPQLQTAILALETYEGGNSEYLWAIDRIDVLDKHRALLASVFAHSTMLNFSFKPSWLQGELVDRITSPPIILNPADRQPLEDGVVFFEGLTESDVDAQPVLFVALDEPSTLRWKDVVPALRTLTDEVEGLLKRLVPLV